MHQNSDHVVYAAVLNSTIVAAWLDISETATISTMSAFRTLGCRIVSARAESSEGREIQIGKMFGG